MAGSNSRSFTFFRITLSLVIALESSMTVLHSLHSSTESHLGKILPWFAGVETVAALLLLVPKTEKIAGWTLLAIFFAAIVIHGPVGQLALFVYAAGVILIIFNPRR